MPSPVNITGVINTTDGTPLQGSAFVRFLLRNYSGYVPRVVGTAAIAATQFDSYPDANGNIVNTCWGNDLITPLNTLASPGWNGTYYTVQFWNNGAITSSANYLITGSAFNIDTAQPLVSPAQLLAGYLMIDTVQAISASGNITSSAANNVFVTATAGASGITIAMPAATIAGQRITVIKIDSAVGAVTITGAIATYYLTNQYQYVVFESDGTNWYIVGGN